MDPLSAFYSNRAGSFSSCRHRVQRHRRLIPRRSCRWRAALELAGAGAPGGGVATGGAAGAALFCTARFCRSKTDEPVPAFLVAIIASVRDVTMNRPAAIVVALDNTVAAHADRKPSGNPCHRMRLPSQPPCHSAARRQ